MPESISLEWAVRSGFLAFMCRDWTDLEHKESVAKAINHWLLHRTDPMRVHDLDRRHKLTIGELLLMRPRVILQIPGIDRNAAFMIRAAVTKLFRATVQDEVPTALLEPDGYPSDGKVIRTGIQVETPLLEAWLDIVRERRRLSDVVAQVQGEPGKLNIHRELARVTSRLRAELGDVERMSLEELEAEVSNLRMAANTLRIALEDRLVTALVQRALKRREVAGE